MKQLFKGFYCVLFCAAFFVLSSCSNLFKSSGGKVTVSFDSATLRAVAVSRESADSATSDTESDDNVVLSITAKGQGYSKISSQKITDESTSALTMTFDEVPVGINLSLAAEVIFGDSTIYSGNTSIDVAEGSNAVSLNLSHTETEISGFMVDDELPYFSTLANVWYVSVNTSSVAAFGLYASSEDVFTALKTSLTNYDWVLSSSSDD